MPGPVLTLRVFLRTALPSRYTGLLFPATLPGNPRFLGRDGQGRPKGLVSLGAGRI
jgi:hypothetical protein